jgi:CAAX protease family protein
METAHKRGSSIHGCLFIAAACVVALISPLKWPWYLLVPLLAYAAIAVSFARLRRTAPPLKVGRLNGAPLLFAVIISLVTSSVLVAFHTWARPDVSELAGNIPIAFFGNLFVAGVCFSVLNAALEEVIFRGVLWGVVADEWNNTVALVATAVLFGIGHLHGYPPGPLGAMLAGVYALALGLLRWWTKGLGLALGCHVIADAAIFSLLCWSGAFAH